MTILPSVDDLRRKYDPDLAHSEQVARLSLQLFDELQFLHQLGCRERQILHAAALLHDIGYGLDNGEAHHKNSLKIILKNGIEGFNQREIQLIANIARYHRKALPSFHHLEYIQLNEEERLIVDKLASLLRIADGLDHPHRGRVHSFSIVFKSELIEVTVKHFNESIKEELLSASKKGDLFRRTFNIDIIFTPLPLFSKPITQSQIPKE